MGEFNEGGYIPSPGPAVPIIIHPDECLIHPDAVRVGRIRCSRAGHPTPTSDCAVRRG